MSSCEKTGVTKESIGFYTNRVGSGRVISEPNNCWTVPCSNHRGAGNPQEEYVYRVAIRSNKLFLCIPSDKSQKITMYGMQKISLKPQHVTYQILHGKRVLFEEIYVSFNSF